MGDILEPGWLVVEGRPLYHRSSVVAGPEAPAIVHIHGFGISGRYLEPTAERLVDDFRNFVPDLPGHGRSTKPERQPDIPAKARSLIAYCDALELERATFVGNSLGCPLICEIANSYRDRIERAVLVSPAGGPNNQPLLRALSQMALDSVREPISLAPIAVRDYLRFGLLSGWSLFRALMRYPTLERVHHLDVPTLAVAGLRDPLIRLERVSVFAGLPHVHAVAIPGAHALNYSRPDTVAALVRAHMNGTPLSGGGYLSRVVELHIPDEPVD
jgi:pimeloyl-ACP methyl ester carboxylesterase